MASGLVLDTGFLLNHGAAAGVVDSSGNRAGTTSECSVDCQNRRTGRYSFERRTGARHTEPDHKDVNRSIQVTPHHPQSHCNVFRYQ